MKNGKMMKNAAMKKMMAMKKGKKGSMMDEANEASKKASYG